MAKAVRIKSPNQRAREQARVERESRERRKRMMLFAGAAAAVAVVALIVVGAISRGDNSVNVPPDVNRDGKTLGDPTAPVTLQAWEDFQCPYCKQANQDALSQVIRDFVQSGQVKIVYRHFAFLGDESSLAAQASEAAAEQGMFWEYHDALFAAQAGENRGAFSSSRLKQMASNVGLDRAVFDAALDSGKYKSVVEAETSEGRKLGLDSTPVFFVNGVKIEGAQPYSVFKSTIESALAAP